MTDKTSHDQQGEPMERILARVQESLSAWLDTHYAGWARDAAIISAARTMSENFTGSVDGRATPRLRGNDRAAYLAYFAPRGIAAFASVLDRLRSLTTNFSPSRIIDVGAGMGTASLVCTEVWPEARLLLMDKDDSALATARELLPEAQVCRAIPTEFQKGDMVVSSFAFAEMCHNIGDDETSEALLRVLHSNVPLVLVDAGDRTSARKLQHFRARALSDGFDVVYPCPHDDSCPALLRERDWCHSRCERMLTDRLANFAKDVGRDESQMSYSVMVFSQHHDRGGDAKSEVIRILSKPRKEKGRVRVPVCGRHNARFLQAKSRNKTAARALLSLEAGQEVSRTSDMSLRNETLHLEPTAKNTEVS